MDICKTNTQTVHIPKHLHTAQSLNSRQLHSLSTYTQFTEPVYLLTRNTAGRAELTQIIKPYSSKLNFTTKLILQHVHRPYEWSHYFRFSEETSVITPSLSCRLHAPQYLCSTIFCTTFSKQHAFSLMSRVPIKRCILQTLVTCGYSPRRGNGVPVQMLATYPFLGGRS